MFLKALLFGISLLSYGYSSYAMILNSDTDSTSSSHSFSVINPLTLPLSDATNPHPLQDKLLYAQVPIIDPRYKIILSFDGGGARGIIPLTILSALETEIETSLSVDMIDMLGGTSVGGLIAAGLALGKHKDFTDNFALYAERIFDKNFRSCSGVFRPSYNSSGKKNLISEIVGDIKGGELTVKFLTTFFSYTTNEAKIYTNFDNNEDFFLKDLLMMTSAAPTYFNPYACKSLHGIKYEGGDGGLFANNTSQFLYLHAKRLFPTSKIALISFGTGQNTFAEPEKSFYNKGLVFWARAFHNIAIDATSNATHSTLQYFAEHDENFKYIRFQIPLAKDETALDDVDPEHIDKLAAITRAYINSGNGAPFFRKVVKLFRKRLSHNQTAARFSNNSSLQESPVTQTTE
ncbi:MAG: patatin-like phospholipase family protein [Holosporaceae bacterium]|jgi:hypothetical protein|nr:patatin-like phospholipase family protein [Holosporaceae bacterium]